MSPYETKLFFQACTDKQLARAINGMYWVACRTHENRDILKTASAAVGELRRRVGIEQATTLLTDNPVVES